jgi:molybdate transport system ATP-binding protein
VKVGIQARLRLQRGRFELTADLDLPGVGVTALFGPSGSGKTTLLRWVAGLQPASGAYLCVNGECWQDDRSGVVLPAHRRPVGYVFQHTTLFAHLDVRANLEFGLRRTPVERRQVGLMQAVDLLGIGHLLDRASRGLSGGELQRVGIARALLSSPRLLLLDEPLAALDLARKREILPYLEQLHAELEIPVLYVSHAPDEVARLADHIVVLDGGRVRASGPLGATLSRLDLPIRLGEDAGVVLEGQVVERDGRWQLARVNTAAGALWVRDGGLPAGSAARIRILARDVSIALEHQESSITNTLPGTISAMVTDDHPALVLMRVRVAQADILARLTHRSAQQLGLAEGARVWVQIKAVALL